MLKSSEQSRVSDLSPAKREMPFPRKDFPAADHTEDFIAQSLDNENTFSKTDLQQSCSQELAKELELINGGFYDFQEKAIRVIGSHLLNIVCDTNLSENQKQKKITELYEHNELYRILGQYGLKHVALIKLIEKLKHHSFGLSKEQVKQLEKHGLPRHLQNLKMFIEQQIIKLPPINWQEKQNLIYKVVEVASIYNMALPEEQWVTKREIEELVVSMSELLYNVSTVEEDRKQMLQSERPMKRNQAVEFFSTSYVSNMIKNDKIMTYSARLDHFLQMMITLKNDLETTPFYKNNRKTNYEATERLKYFKKFYNELVRIYEIAPRQDPFTKELEDLCYERCFLKARFDGWSGAAYDYLGGYNRMLGDKKGYYLGGDELRAIFREAEGVNKEEIDAISNELFESMYDGEKTFKGRDTVITLQNGLTKMGTEKFIDSLHILYNLKTRKKKIGLEYKNIFQMSKSLVELNEFITEISGHGKSINHLKSIDHSVWDKESFRIKEMIDVVGGKEVAIFFNKIYVEHYKDMEIGELHGNALGKYIYAAGGAEAAIKLTHNYLSQNKGPSLLFQFIKSLYKKEVGEGFFWIDEEEKRKDLLETATKAKLQIIRFQVGKTQSEKFEEALKLCSFMTDPIRKKEFQIKLLRDISYETIQGKRCIIFPKDIMPHPRSIEDVTPDEFQSKFGVALKHGKSFRPKKAGMFGDLGTRYLYSHEGIRQTNKDARVRYIPSSDDMEKVFRWLKIDVLHIDHFKFTTADLFSKLCNLGFPGTPKFYSGGPFGGNGEEVRSWYQESEECYVRLHNNNSHRRDGGRVCLLSRNAGSMNNMNKEEPAILRCYAYPDDKLVETPKNRPGTSIAGPK